MSLKLRQRFFLYLAGSHILFACGGFLALAAHPIWLLALEGVLALSLGAGVWLVRRSFGTLDLIRSGAEFIADRDFTCHFSPTGQAEMDQLVEVYNTMADQLRRERQNLQEQHFFLQKVIDASPLGILTLDFDGCLDLVNPAAARILQRDALSMRGSRLQDLDSAFAMALSELKVDETRVHTIGGWRLIRCHRAQFFDRGFPRQVLLLEELTDELRQSEKAAYEKLIRMMSHEVNNTVASTGSLLESCLSFAPQIDCEDRSDYEMALRAVIGRAAELNRFMQGYADVVRLPAPTVNPCDLTALMEDIHILFRAEFERRRIAWITEPSPALPLVSLDRNQMERALINIVRNAMESMEENGTFTVRIQATTENGGAVLTMSDTGAGIPPDVADRIFTPFFSTKPNGQGIGLTLVREILEGHRFPFSLESRSPGLTEFTIHFPRF